MLRKDWSRQEDTRIHKHHTGCHRSMTLELSHKLDDMKMLLLDVGMLHMMLILWVGQITKTEERGRRACHTCSTSMLTHWKKNILKSRKLQWNSSINQKNRTQRRDRSRRNKMKLSQKSAERVYEVTKWWWNHWQSFCCRIRMKKSNAAAFLVTKHPKMRTWSLVKMQNSHLRLERRNKYN